MKLGVQRLRRNAHAFWKLEARVVALACAVSASAFASEGDDFDVTGRSDTNFQMFGRALLPGPGGAIVETRNLAPLHQSISARATRIDSPLGRDSVEMQVAAFGQIVGGDPQDLRDATWDVASAFIRQRAGAVEFTLGRQNIVGGAARYSRMDGLRVRGDLGSPVVLEGYAGWTALPRWDQRYGYHHLGDGYDEWASDPQAVRDLSRSEHWMGGARFGWDETGVGSLGMSFHHQMEDAALFNQVLGFNGSLTKLEKVELFFDALMNPGQGRFSDVRMSADWDAFRSKKRDVAVSVRGELLHTVPSLMLSQSSVFSVFSQQEVTEIGGELTARLPYRLRLRAAGYGQMFLDGESGLRSHLRLRYAVDERGTFVVRAQIGRVDTGQSGYTMLRVAARHAFAPGWSWMSDGYHYVYDEVIRGRKTSSFVGTHLGYEWPEPLRVRLGASVAQTPYASLDAQLMARLTYHFGEGRSR